MKQANYLCHSSLGPDISRPTDFKEENIKISKVLSLPNTSPLMSREYYVKFQGPEEEVRGAVEAAIDAGYRLIDTANIYITEEQV